MTPTPPSSPSPPTTPAPPPAATQQPQCTMPASWISNRLKILYASDSEQLSNFGHLDTGSVSFSQTELMDNDLSLFSNDVLQQKALKPIGFEVKTGTVPRCNNNNNNNNKYKQSCAGMSTMIHEQLNAPQLLALSKNPILLPQARSPFRLYQRQVNGQREHLPNKIERENETSTTSSQMGQMTAPVSEDAKLYKEHFPPLPAPKRNGMPK
ncbi:uncharacterized protein LOC111596765 [Drosophila hydei]|uniref:Uncharacterized protein LOC111596765 n=1 Tax=Drosophila hydei TaxID=7224 RepID=A0A6J1LK39_DROHY|nr:uncharacterized protein LOC111596765 [Drosophila hydei]